MAEGRIAFWRYRNPSSGYRGYHFTADLEGCAFMLGQLAHEPSFRIELTVPTRAVLSVTNSKADAVPFVELLVESSNPDAQDLVVQEKHPRCRLLLSPAGRDLFRKGIEDLAGGSGDYSIGADGAEVWFWWWPTRG